MVQCPEKMGYHIECIPYIKDNVSWLTILCRSGVVTTLFMFTWMDLKHTPAEECRTGAITWTCYTKTLTAYMASEKTYISCRLFSVYRIDGKFDKELNLAVSQLGL